MTFQTRLTLVCVAFWIPFFSPHCYVTVYQNSSWPWIAQQPPKIILQPRRRAKKLCENRLGESDCWKILTDFFLLFMFVTGAPEKGMTGRERENGVVRLPCMLGGGCDHDWQKRDNSEGKGRQDQTQELRWAVMVMHVTSMRPCQEELGMGSAPHPVS